MKRQLLADFTLLLITFVWGATFLVVQNAIAFLPPTTFNAVRFTIASLFLLVILMLFFRNQRKTFSKPLLLSGFFLGLWLCLGYALQTMGLQYTTSSKAGFLTGLSVVLVPLLTFVLLREKVKWIAVAGAITAACGLYLLTLNQTLQINLGDVLVFGCSICFALQIVFTGKFSPKFAALPLAIVQLGTVALLSWIYSFCFEEWQLAFQTDSLLRPQVIWGLFITAIPGTALAFLAQTAFQKQTTATRIALIFALEPVFAALTSYVWIDEQLSSRQFLGCALIFAGMILAELPIHVWLREWRKARVLVKEDEVRAED